MSIKVLFHLEQKEHRRKGIMPAHQQYRPQGMILEHYEPSH